MVGQLCDAFAEQWYFATAEVLDGPDWFPRLQPLAQACARVITSGPDQDLEKIELLVLEAIGCARTSIKVMTPYFLPDERIITALALAAMRGVGVDIVLPARTNHPTIDWAMRAHIDPLLAAGCRVWAHAPPFNHSKLMAIDGLWCLIGSANWDTRSFRLNFEVDLEAYHAHTVAQVSAKIAAHQTVLLTAAELAGALVGRVHPRPAVAAAHALSVGDLSECCLECWQQCHLRVLPPQLGEQQARLLAQLAHDHPGAVAVCPMGE